MNGHAEAAQANIVQAVTTGDARVLAAAQTYATLALAYEQRTANLLQLRALVDTSHTVLSGVDYADVCTQIKERLGLT